MRSFKRLTLALIMALALVLAFPLTMAAAPAATTKPAASIKHAKPAPTIPQATMTSRLPRYTSKAQAQQIAHPFLAHGSRPPAQTPNVTTGRSGSGSGGDLNYHNGGRVLHDPKIYIIFWGSSWNGSDASAKNTILDFFATVGYTGYNNLLTQYFDSTRIDGDIQAVSYVVDPTFTGHDNSCSGGGGAPYSTVYNQDILNEVVYVANAVNWTLDPNNGLYFVYTPAGTYVNNPGFSSTPCSDIYYQAAAGGYCAYHSWFYFSGSPSVTYPYAAMPYPTWQGGCGPLPSFPNNVIGDQEVNLSSHEMSEAITDPNLNAWYDAVGYEIGDKCAWQFPTSNSGGYTYLRLGWFFTIQLEFSNNFSGCNNFERDWYFAEGYTGGSFTEYLTLENPTATTANVVVEYLLGGGSPPAYQFTTVAANKRATINVNSLALSNHNVSMIVTADQPIVAERPMYFTDTSPYLSGPVPGGTDVLGMNQLQSSFYFGYLDTSSNHDTWLTVLNPNPSTMNTTFAYVPAAGGPITYISHSFSPNSRGTIHVNAEGLTPGIYGAAVFLSAPGMVERPMYLIDSWTNYTGAADVVGNTTGGQTTWNFAEGYTNTNFSERYILFNLSGTAASTTVTFYRTDGTTASTTVPVPSGQVVTVLANSILGNGVSNSATVTSSQPIIAERFMSFSFTGLSGYTIPGATDVMGSPTTSSEFLFAEGYTGTGFAEYLTLENPAPTAANVTVYYFVQGGSTVVQSYSVGAQSRKTVFTNGISGVAGHSFSMDVVSDQPILAERPMYFDYSGSQTGGSDVIGYIWPDAA